MFNIWSRFTPKGNDRFTGVADEKYKNSWKFQCF